MIDVLDTAAARQALDRGVLQLPRAAPGRCPCAGHARERTVRTTGVAVLTA